VVIYADTDLFSSEKFDSASPDRHIFL